MRKTTRNFFYKSHFILIIVLVIFKNGMGIHGSNRHWIDIETTLNSENKKKTPEVLNNGGF